MLLVGDSLYPPWVAEDSAVFTPLGKEERADLAASAAPKERSPQGDFCAAPRALHLQPTRQSEMSGLGISFEEEPR